MATSSTGTPIPCTPSPGTVQQTIAATHGPYGDCHRVALPSGETAGEPDFAEFLVYGGQTYLSGIPQGTDADRGEVVFRVRCSFGAFSDSLNGTTQGAVEADGDAAFLAADTSVYAVKGALPQCRLMAKESDGWHTYASSGPGCATPAPIATALPTHD